MRRAIVFLSVIIGTICAIRLLVPWSPFELVGIDAPVAWIGFGVASLGILFEWDWLQRLNIGYFFHALSIVLLTMTIFAIASPTYAGILANYVHVADNFITLESSIVLWLLGSEQREDSLPPLFYIGLIVELFARRLNQQLTILTVRHSHRHAS